MVSLSHAERGQTAPTDQQILLDAQRLAAIQDLAQRNGEMGDRARMVHVLDSVLAPVLSQDVLALATWQNGQPSLLVASRTRLKAAALAEIRERLEAEHRLGNGLDATPHGWQERLLPPREPEAAPGALPPALVVLALPLDVATTARTALLVATHKPLEKADVAFLRTALIVANTAGVRQGIDSLAANYAFQQAIEYATQSGIVVTDLAGRVIFANQGFCRMIGQTQADVIGQEAPYAGWLAPEVQAQLPQLAALLAGDVPTNEIELTMARRDGRPFPAQLSVTPMLQHGQHSGWLVNVTDVSKLRHAEMRYRLLFDEAPMMYVVTRLADGGPLIAECNQAFVEMLGYTKGEVIGRPLTDFYTSESASALRQDGYRRALAGFLRGEERTLVTREGKQIDVLLQARPERDASGTVTGTRAGFVDVSEMRNLNRRMLAANLISELSLSAATTNEIFDIVPGILCEHLPFDACLVHMGSVADDFELALAGSSGIDRAAHANALARLHDLVPAVMRAEQTFYAAAPDELAGSPLGETLAALGAQAAVVLPLAGAAGGIGVLTLLANEGEEITAPVIRILLSIANVLSQAVHGIWVDEALAAERVSLERRVEERTVELRLANHELARAARLKDEFLANMSHELRTPLSGILGLTEVMERGIYGALNEKQLVALQNVQESGKHLLALINDVLDLSKIGADKLTLERAPLSVDDICRASIRFVIQLATEKRQTITYTPTPPGLVLKADARRLKQMLVNLLGNAVKFTAVRGMIGLDVVYTAERGTIDFTVWDNGMGISPTGLAQLFEPFVQLEGGLNRRFEGSGLGLVLVKRLAQLHGGDVSVESIEGEGSRFTISLPADGVTVAPGTRQPAKAVSVPPQDTALLVRRVRQIGSADVVGVMLGEALAKVQALQPVLVVLDIPQLEQASWTLLRELHQLPAAQRPPVLVLSAGDERRKAAHAGADGFVASPCTEDDLGAEIVRVLGTTTLPEGPVLVVGVESMLHWILIAEDNDINFTIVSDYLAALGHTILRAKDGQETLAKVIEHRPDLVLMDIHMHKINGLEVIRRIRALDDNELAHTPIVALTALAMDGDRERCLAAGADDYLAKPADFDKLRGVVNRLAATRHQP